MSDTAVLMRGIEKSFGTNKVLHSVDFSLKKGSIHALLGENGAGKTTLMNILGGVLPKDSGTIEVEGKVVNIGSTSAAKALGIGFIHQELTLVNDLKVYENLFLGEEIRGKFRLLNKKVMLEKSKEVLDRMGVNLNPMTDVKDLNASYKQVVEIARALMRDAKIVIMDEPTASLTDVEIDHVFTIMRSLRDQGISLVFISHKLNEVVAVCDSYTVMRNGEMVADGPVDAGITESVLSAHMVGKELSYDDLYSARETGEMLLEVSGLERDRQYRNINFNIKKGEIVGFTGLLGDGRNELFESIVGANYPYKGEIRVQGKAVEMTLCSKAHRRGIAYVPRNRKENGIIKDLSIRSNISLSVLKRVKQGIFISRKKENDLADKYVDELQIKVHNLNNLITSLSGGNQQKVV
ncbi:MAG: sugar ABC transporter ATP-binding protein, partial [Oscillospiraceae bacterium]|nr:sugar ABC transporter ATP-binding protein [Oscillospiraceae bacterium]